MSSSSNTGKWSKLEFTVQLTIKAEIRFLLDFSWAMDSTDNFGVALLNICRALGLSDDASF